MKTEIYVATHKAYTFPDIPEYIPIHVGKALTDLDLNIQGDDTGENISNLNKSFCELTALYWMWKNSDADIIGLAHYRRYFTKNKKIISNDEIVNILNQGYDVIVSKPVILRKRKVFLQNVKTHFASNHYEKDWDIIKTIILENEPRYFLAFEEVEKKYRISLYNMFVCRKDILDQYCSWLFKILFLYKDSVDIGNYDAYQYRLIGFVAERLFNVYMVHNKLNLYPIATLKTD
ncbi:MULTISPECIES: DUF4422 domain-containing protein [Acinetobacter calcoaceticus/baumannii complex]|uniref:Gtr187 n=1 Tax=Acinetobacter baumannii TaxID=470 RepID=A0A481WX76_ACIBA|nr:MULTISPECIES: DUF4422 domain-containing protein [Acinetobacter calcoaceticus/baumannii complex]EXE25489.1 hypothetical protein J569_2820 [Acinetobacter sp. 907131]EXH34806.1 hypothetical protein J623_1158 [Acinetobacter sp. 1245249]EYT28447.1 hypothetical protein J622_00253 [Acinetobacter sp. 1564232]QBK17817.1 Gtr187 [Acinetobacter baumannii]